MVEESQVSEDEAEVCIAEWVGNTKGKPMACSFLKLGLGKKEEMQFMFDVLKCDELFDMLLSNNVIRLKGGHVIPTADQLAPKNIVSGMIHFHILLTNAIVSVDRYNQP
jgi:hypothetical protein